MPNWRSTRYRPRDPERSILYRAVAEHLPRLLATLDEADRGVPSFVKRELEGFLRCGVAQHGAALARCRSCGYERLVPWSCKGRGFCPACTARRMNDTAAFLVDQVFPLQPVRMWVISFPPPLRYLLAYDAEVQSAVVGLFVREVYTWLRNTAKRELGLRSCVEASPASVTFLQRFGDGLRVNPHLHMLALDGVYVQHKRDSTPEFHALPAPSSVDLRVVGNTVWMRVTRLLQKLGKYFDADPADTDTLAQQYPLLAACYAAAIQNTVALGERAGHGVMQLALHGPPEHEHTDADSVGNASTSRPMHGFNVHAGVRIAAQDRSRLERVCRYAARGPIALERLSRSPDGKLVLRLRKKFRNGATHLAFSPTEFLEKLCALVPPPRLNLVRYHGAFAPNHRLRAQIVGPTREEHLRTPKQMKLFRRRSSKRQRKDGRDRALPRDRMPWRDLLKRTFHEDTVVCPRCHGTLRIVTPCLPFAAIQRFLDATESQPIPSPQRARAPPSPEGQLSLFPSFENAA